MDYPKTWRSLGNKGAPNTEQYFSDENAGSPLALSPSGVFLSVSARAAPCSPNPTFYRVDGQATLNVNGEPVVRTYGYFAPSGGEQSWAILAAVPQGQKCFAFQFTTTTQAARDANVATADRIITSFRAG